MAVETLRSDLRPHRDAAAATGDFDVMVLDTVLPGLSGHQVLRDKGREVWTPGRKLAHQSAGSAARLHNGLHCALSVFTVVDPYRHTP